ncbi:MAG: 1-acyl-sn-glycerol-3-phosphate acyltransferase [Bacteroidota bacterium]|nr:1-acyl-sn-glycerol-3-phosphate acyltransferase [Bacteroidota bacterium]
MKKILSKIVFKLIGWKVVGIIPELNKYLAISAPHTSNWDFLIGRCFAYIVGLKPKYLIKSELYFWPLSVLINLNGGIPVYRKTGKNTVDQVVERIKQEDKFILGIAPEGTRKRVEKWKTGFYYIAQRSNVPIVLMYMDYQKKEVGYFDVLTPTGDIQKDLAIIQDYYKDVVGCKPEQYNPKIF